MIVLCIVKQVENKLILFLWETYPDVHCYILEESIERA